MSLWEGLPEGILDQILNDVALLSDFIRAGSVCKTWYNVFLQRKRYRIEQCKNEVPLVLIPETILPNEGNSSSTINSNVIIPSPNQIFNIFDKRCYDSLSPAIENINLIPTVGKSTLISSYGYVATVIKEKGDIIMILNNPVTGNTIYLPTLVDDEVCKVHMVVLSCNPSIYPDKCVVAYLSEFSARFLRLGSNNWNKLALTTQKEIESIVFHKGQWYGLYSDWGVFAIDCFWESKDGDNCDFQTCDIVGTSNRKRKRDIDGFMMGTKGLYMAESCGGELLMIARFKTVGFNVYKLVITNVDGNKSKGHWDRIHRLGNGDEALFVSGHSNVISSKCKNLKPDSVYYLYGPYNSDKDKDISGRGCHDMFIAPLNRERDRIVRVKLGKKLENGFIPYWINPTLQ